MCVVLPPQQVSNVIVQVSLPDDLTLANGGLTLSDGTLLIDCANAQ